jgi:hypothetical protein
MPQQLTSISTRPHRPLLSGEERAQHEFIRKLGPYFSRAKFENQGPQFLQRAFNVWFARWPLYLRDFEDAGFMHHRRQSIEKVSISCTHDIIHGFLLFRILLVVYGGRVSAQPSQNTHGKGICRSVRPDMELLPG